MESPVGRSPLHHISEPEAEADGIHSDIFDSDDSVISENGDGVPRESLVGMGVEDMVRDEFIFFVRTFSDFRCADDIYSVAVFSSIQQAGKIAEIIRRQENAAKRKAVNAKVWKESDRSCTEQKDETNEPKEKKTKNSV